VLDRLGLRSPKIENSKIEEALRRLPGTIPRAA
jgi:hypothetical protein